MSESVYVPGGSTNVQVLVPGSLDLSQPSGAPGVVLEAMQAAVAQISESNPKAIGVAAKNYLNDRYLRLEEEGFVKKIWGK